MASTEVVESLLNAPAAELKIGLRAPVLRKAASIAGYGAGASCYSPKPVEDQKSPRRSRTPGGFTLDATGGTTIKTSRK